LYAGTDDGNVWTSPDDGRSWTDLTARFRNLVPARTYVSRIEPSRYDASTFYVTFDNHREGDFTPYVFVTVDGGRTFTSIVNNLPRGGPDFVHVIREDPVNRDLLYLGTDVGAYVSLDRGASWQRFMNGLPTVPVHDLKIHPRDRELIAGTHGRSIFIVDVAQLQQVKPRQMAAEPVLFESKPAIRYGNPPVGGESAGNKTWNVQSPGVGAELVFYVPPGASGPAARVVVLNARGDTVQTINGQTGSGMQRVLWNLRPRAQPARQLTVAERRDSVWLTRRLDVVIDSLNLAGGDSATLNRVAAQIRNPPQAFGGRGGGGGGTVSQFTPPWIERAGETPAVPGRAGGAGRAGGGGGGGAEVGGGGRGGGGGPDAELAGQVRGLIRAPGGRAILYPVGGGAGFGGGGGGGGAPQPALVDPGEYTVNVIIGGRTLTQRIRVQ